MHRRFRPYRTRKRHSRAMFLRFFRSQPAWPGGIWGVAKTRKNMTLQGRICTYLTRFMASAILPSRNPCAVYKFSAFQEQKTKKILPCAPSILRRPHNEKATGREKNEKKNSSGLRWSFRRGAVAYFVVSGGTSRGKAIAMSEKMPEAIFLCIFRGALFFDVRGSSFWPLRLSCPDLCEVP